MKLSEFDFELPEELIAQHPKDVECTDENINKILNGKDLSNGILVFINGGQNNDEMMEKIKNATGLNEWKWIKGLNACNIYLVK